MNLLGDNSNLDGGRWLIPYPVGDWQVAAESTTGVRLVALRRTRLASTRGDWTTAATTLVDVQLTAGLQVQPLRLTRTRPDRDCLLEVEVIGEVTRLDLDPVGDGRVEELVRARDGTITARTR